MKDMKKAVVASDSFKGSLTSIEVANAMEIGIRNVFPQCNVIKTNVADGGKGTVEATIKSLGGDLYTTAVMSPLGRPIEAEYGAVNLNGVRTAVIEMSSTSGLPLLLPGEQSPWITSTYGTGGMILDALDRGCRELLVGISGGAISDAGTGMFSALGMKFFDSQGQRLKGYSKDLKSTAQVDMLSLVPEARRSEFTVAYDVNTPFRGLNGAAHVFAPQKGTDSQMVKTLDGGMYSFVKIIVEQLQKDIIPLSGAGAAGGLGGAFKAFLDVRLIRGIEMVLDAIGFDSILEGADLVITGEGRIDFQAATDKTAAGILRHAKQKGIPTLAIGGSVEMYQELKEMGSIGIYSIMNTPISLEETMQKDSATASMQSMAEQILATIKYYTENKQE